MDNKTKEIAAEITSTYEDVYGESIDDADARVAASIAAETWGGDGYYLIMQDGHSWGYAEPEWYEDEIDLAISLSFAVKQAVFSCSIWAYPMTIAEFNELTDTECYTFA